MNAPRAGIIYAALAAVLFGLSTPFAKLLLGDQPPVLLAGLLYLGSGLGLMTAHALRRARRIETAPLPKGKWPWLAGAIGFGGVLAPVLLMTGLQTTSASSASLLLNLEGVLTAILAWTLGRENAGRRIILGMAIIVVGGAVLSWPGSETGFAVSLGSLIIAAACLAWAIDNNLTQAVSSADAIFLAGIKGLVAGIVNVAIALLALGAALPGPLHIAAALAVGLLGYGVSLVCFILALRHVGTARTGAYFAVAPFVGSASSFALLTEELSVRFFVAAGLMGIGVWLHVTERHEHKHAHEAMTHTHRHIHDEHHRHPHGDGKAADEPHTHEHTHEPVVHMHLHWPDIHHRHEHR